MTQEAKIQTLQQTASDLIEQEHYHSDVIQGRIEAVMKRYNLLH